MATQSKLASKVADINRLINHVFTREEMTRKLRRQGVLDEDTNIIRRADLEREIKLAKSTGDDEKAEKLQKELDDMLNPKLSWGTSLIKSQTGNEKKLSEAERVHQINLRNQKLNYENVRRAQLEERKAARKSAAAVARGEAAPDPFMRVRTVAKTHHDVSEKPKDAPASEATPTDTPKEASKASKPVRPVASSGTTSKKPKNGFMITYQKTDDEVIAALDLDIDIEI